MTDDLLTSFRSDVPLPDEATARRIYARATSGRLTRRVPGARLALAGALAVATIGGTVAALVATGTIGGETTATTPRVALGQAPYNALAWNFTASDHTFTSIALTIRAKIADATMQLRVVRSDATQVPQAYRAASRVVFQEQVPMADLQSPATDGTLSTWSGEILPGNWDGGCDNALYRIETAEYPAGKSIDNPFESAETERDSTGWFQCSGPAVNPADPFPNHFPN